MLPENVILGDTIANAERYIAPSLGFRIDFKSGELGGVIDEKDELEQAIYLILHIERYKYICFSANVGVEFCELYGQPKQLIIPSLQSRITEALMADDRIEGLADFSCEEYKGKYMVSFVANTTFGDIEIESEADIFE